METLKNIWFNTWSNTAESIRANRKFSLALLFAITVIVALFTGFLNGDQFINAMAWILGLYGLANVGQTYSEIKNSAGENK